MPPPSITAPEFVKKWAASTRTERAASQEHFIDLCRLLAEATPNEADPTGDFYAFEKGAEKTGGAGGFADVWLKGHFGWEYKGKHKDLRAAYKQLVDYHEALGNPPLLVVCDMERFEVHTKWTNTETWTYRFHSGEIATDNPVEVTTAAGPARDAPSLTALQVLKALFEDPNRLRPGRTTEQITAEAARLFGEISDELRKWRGDDMRIARFITRVLFCMFATDVGLLPRQTFADVIRVNKGRTADFVATLSELFRTMNQGGRFGAYPVPYFDGRLFEDGDVPDDLTGQEILTLEKLSNLNWADVEPAIFGTLFERILDPSQRRQFGAHYTSRADIELIVEPVLMTPLRREWERVEQEIEDYLAQAEARGATDETRRARIGALLRAFHERLFSIRVLDPACGSGNFLYVSLAQLKALEKEVVALATLYGVEGIAPRVHPRQLFGIELNPYAHELASIVIWIGYLQWKHRNAVPLDDETPILQPLDQIEFKDAILDRSDPEHPVEPAWPEVDVIVGNPPFLGGKRLRTELGDTCVGQLFAVWDGRVAREADLCCYWFEKARAAIEAGRAKRAGLLATQAIRGGANRRVLERIKASGDIFYAQSDRPWIQKGVAVRVAMVGFDGGSETQRLLNESKDDPTEVALARARPVEGINANLTSRLDLTKARRLKENLGICFQGPVKVGSFDIDWRLAQQFVASPNPDGRQNSDVVRPWLNGRDIASRPSGKFIIDFGELPESEAMMYEAPFEYVRRVVGPVRRANRDRQRRENWWRLGRSGSDLKRATERLTRFICTPRVAKHRLFVWVSARTMPDSRLFAVAREDDYFFGVLHSRIHEVWALATSSRHGVGNDPTYNNTTCFETFPLPQPTPEQEEAVATAARELDRLRQGWLNPEPAGGLPLPEAELKQRTLTNLYNQRPAWLANAHAALDAAVFAAYGWPANLGDEEILARLLQLNLEREAV